MHPKEAIYFTFNKFFYDFLEDIKSADAELAAYVKAGYKVKNLQSEKNLDAFVKNNSENLFSELLNVSDGEQLFSSKALTDTYLAKSITLDTIKKRLDKDCTNTIACYVFHFVLMKLLLDFANKEDDESNVRALFNQVMQVLRLIQNKADYSDALSEIIDDDIKGLLGKIEKTAVAILEEEEEPHENLEKTAEDMAASLDNLENTKIGSMAKEISQELDLKDLQIEKPEDVFKIMSGDNLGKIIGKVGNKINQKISNGELKHEDLVNETISMVSSMTGGGGFNPILANLMKNMGGMGNFAGMAKGGKMRVDETKLRSMSTKERLKKKLDEKRTSK